MAHNITYKDSIAYSGETPWHGIGKVLDGLASPADMLREAGLDWHVQTVPLYIPETDGPSYNAVPDFVGIQREDTRDILGVASDKYKVLQNSQAFEIVDALVAEGGAVVEVAGSIREGRMCWALSQLPGEFEVVKGDTVRPYFLLAWGHDGKHGVAGVLTPVRVVCNNTLTAALGTKWSKTAQIYFRHFGDMKIRIAEAHKALGIVKTQVETTKTAYQSLAGHRMGQADLVEYFSDLFPSPKASQNDTPDDFESRMNSWQGLQNDLVHLYQQGAGNDMAAVSGTAWAAYNAITEYLDHQYPTLKNGGISSARQQSVLFGSKATLKAQALKNALALVR